MKYNKLVRDLIPDIIRQRGDQPKTHIATDEEYQVKLVEKLQEEVDEFKASGEIEELADIVEVIETLSLVKGSNLESILMIKADKQLKRGGFKQKIILEES